MAERSHSPFVRSLSVISAMIEMAISAGERAPMASPTGP
jgi:hypothetical protein